MRDTRGCKEYVGCCGIISILEVSRRMVIWKAVANLDGDDRTGLMKGMER